MVTTHNLGFPRIGLNRELKFAQEGYWRGEHDAKHLLDTASILRARHWDLQAGLNWVPVGDFSLYDQMLDMSFTLGCIPKRAQGFKGDTLDNYFRVARGRSSPVCDVCAVAAGEMTKWFDTNYHFIVPEFGADTEFKLNVDRLKDQWEEAKAQGINAKPVIIGPVTYLYLGKAKKKGVDRLTLLSKLLPLYAELLQEFHDWGATWVQVDEPVLVLDLPQEWQHAFNLAYHEFKTVPVQILLTTYFAGLGENCYLAANLPVAGLHIDAVRGFDDVATLVNLLPENKVLSLGVIDGRNIWKADLDALLTLLEPLHKKLGDRLWIAPSCSLLHVPIDLEVEALLDPEICSWLAFSCQKLDELALLARALNKGQDAVENELFVHRTAIFSRKKSIRVQRPEVQAELSAWHDDLGVRLSPYSYRAKVQQARFKLPILPTTTIGSFPQTREIRQARKNFKAGEIDQTAYDDAMRREIEYCVREQESLGIDVLVHGEAERNDMVEYFGELLEGYIFSKNGWVQSYGSRCVKPPILYGDVFRRKAMTVAWSKYAASLTDKPMKGMLTGPVTMLNWSFVRDDQPREITCRQLALAIRAEVQDLEAAGIGIIQIDEPALREGLPLRSSAQLRYLQWAGACFRVAANGVDNGTQIHTHMCYSEFNDIIEYIAALDADVLTIETARSNMEVLEVFERFSYPNEIGPGVYDIHSPNIPEVARMVNLLKRASEHIPVERLWVNPDCGLKTRQWAEVNLSLQNMLAAARELRQSQKTLKGALQPDDKVHDLKPVLSDQG